MLRLSKPRLGHFKEEDTPKPRESKPASHQDILPSDCKKRRTEHRATSPQQPGRILEANFPHLYWILCVAYCIDLILEDIFKVRVFKETSCKAIELIGFIYGSSGVLNMLRNFTKGVELLRPGKTRFATTFITLGRIHLQKANIRKMFTSENWTTSKWAKEVKGKKCERTVLSPAFWNHVVYALKVSGPLVCVLRLVNNEKKLAMGYIYEVMDRAKETNANSFNGNEEKYKHIFEIIDARWSVQLHHPLHAARYFLNPEFFLSKQDEN
ncbi:uncharacterized protein LOC110663940 [Hevea brasiliensis]|uniref:uncharacterized protein LOC110663940 n=1 Tax=Hevea brasiliensis TaxID=3981 RepID=UPI0025F29CCD|nr:uncharacterized protein LOC110663940 [Hevea brasiliensis]